MSRLRLLIGLAVVAALAMSAGAPVWWSGPAFVALWLLLFGIGLAWVPRDLLADERLALAVAGAGGLAAAWLAWTASGYLTGGFAVGSVAVVAASLFGWWRAMRVDSIRSVLRRAADSPALVVLTAALAIGFYLSGLNEIWGGDRVYFTYRYDWDVHLHVAGVISELGLPKMEHSGSPQFPVDAVSHVGWPVLVAGVDNLTRTSLFTAARSLALGGYAILALAAYSVAARRLGRPVAVIAVALAPLLWGSLEIALALGRGDVPVILDLKSSGPALVVSGVMYYNMTQLFSVALVAAGLAILDREDRSGAGELAASFALIAVSTAIKPALAIVFVPAALIVTAAARRFVALAILLGACAAVAVIYFLPAILADSPLPSRPGWQIGLNRTPGDLAIRLGFSVGVFWLVLGRWAKPIIDGIRARVVEPRSIIAVALGGTLIFAAAFSEATRDHGNHYWPLLGTLVVMTPFALVTIAGWPRARAIGGALVAVHIAGGLIYAASSPHHGLRSIDAAQVEAVQRMRELTGPDARIFVDPRARKLLGPFLRRRASWYPPLILEERAAYERWAAAVSDEVRLDASILAGRDAVILAGRARRLREALADLGWTRVYSREGTALELWLSPAHVDLP